MKIHCNACEAAEATVLCCADEAALCWGCDRKVHAANKLAGKHQRFPLSASSSQMPICDICQEAAGYFFCLEDRALLCRKCDVAIHRVNSLVSSHQRFLLTGVRVGPELTEAHQPPPPSLVKTRTTEKISEPESHLLSNWTSPVSSACPHNKSPLVQASACDAFPSSKTPFAGGPSQWELDEFIGLSDFNFVDDVSSKADGGKLGDSTCSQIIRAGDGELEGFECLDQVPETYWAVPDIPDSLHTSTMSPRLYWPEDCQHVSDPAIFVPDISCSLHDTSIKRRKHFV